MSVNGVPCPVCRRRRWRSDLICIGCEKRVRAVRPDLLQRHASMLNTHTPEFEQLQTDILACAIQQLPKRGAPQKGAAS